MSEKVTKSWVGQYGEAYTKKWVLSPMALNDLWNRMVGATRTSIIQSILMPNSGRVLELGCNVGNQLLMLHDKFGFPYVDLWGVDIVPEAVSQAVERGFNVVNWNFLREIPFSTGFFDIVMTCGSLCHVPPDDLKKVAHFNLVMQPRYIFSTEYTDGKEWDGFRHGQFHHSSIMPCTYELRRSETYEAGDGSAMTAVLLGRKDVE